MKTECEFIDSVYKKYEIAKSEQNRRIKLYKTMSLCAAAACICLVTFVGIRTIPYLNATNESVAYDTANGDPYYYLYSSKTVSEDGVAVTVPESAAGMVISASPTEAAKEAPERTMSVFMDDADAVYEEATEAKAIFSFNITTPETSKLISNSFNYAVSLAEDIVCDVYYTDFPEMEILDTDIAEENSEVSYGSCKISGESKYYINIKNNTALVLIEQNHYTQDEFYMIANSIEY